MLKQSINWPEPDRMPRAFPEEAPHVHQLQKQAIQFLNEAQREVLSVHSEEVQLVYSAKMDQAYAKIVREWKAKLIEFELDPTKEQSQECSLL